MRHFVIGVICVGVLALAAAPAGAAHARRARPLACPPARGKVVAADVQATLYEAAPAGYLPEALQVLGCVRGGTRRYDLGNVPSCGLFEPGCDGVSECGTGTGCGGVRHEVLAGAMVAFESFETGPEEGLWYVVVRDLRTGRLVVHVPTGVPLVPERYFAGVGTVVRIVLKSDGSVAWLANDFDRSRPEGALGPEVHYYDVYAAEGSVTRLLAAGTDIDPSSLALAGSTVYWIEAGKPASAELK
ncbi:MAG TPA: hypothetical protein VMF09_12445 [Solirubrobacteraceae bacterium]|nr:hypothetical protein [Solirubrobacteraceae bacterium]